MKNLKKALALVLIAVMAFSLVTMASAKTNFTDDKDIKYTTAVGVMTGIGAINGYVDGSFQPKGLVTRAEAAKMVAYAVLGPTVAAALKTTTTSFSDVPASHWASPYIEWAVSRGILNGLGDGTFNPNGNVTAFELAKMMLCAAGYGKNDEYIGPNWSINVASDGMKYNVFYGNETANFASAATREEAALYIFNGVYRVHQVDYNELFGYYGKGYSVTSGTQGDTIAQDTYDMSNVKGVVTGGVVSGAATTGTYVAKATINDDGEVTAFAAPAKYAFEATAADMGQLVSLYVNGTTGKVFYSETVSKTASVIGLATSTPTGYNNAFGSLTMAPAVAVYNFAANYASSSVATGTSAANAATLGMTVGTVAPVGTYAIYGGQIVSYAAASTTTFDKVTAVSTSTGAESITFAALGQKSNTANNDILSEYKGIAVGDYVTVKQIGTKYAVEKVTTVSGSISSIGYFLGMTWFVTMDGKQYSASGATGTADVNEVFPSATDFAKNTYTLYLDSAGNWITCTLKSGANASSVVYATGLTWAASGDYGPVYKAQCVNSAGEQVTYNLATNQAITGGFYSVSINSTTGLATLTANPTTNFAASAATTVAATDVTNQAHYYYASDVKFIFVSGTGANLKITTVTGLAAVAGISLDANDGLFLNPTAGSNYTINTVMVSGSFSGATTAPVMYLDNDVLPDSYNGTNTNYYVYIDGVMTKITTKNASVTDIIGFWPFGAGQFVSYTVDSNNVYTITGVSTASNAHAQQTIATNGIYNNYFTVGGTTYNATGAKVIDLSQGFGEPLVYTSMAAMAAATATTTFTVSFVTNADGVVTTIYVERAV